MEPVSTTAAVLAIAGAVIRWGVQEWRWHKSEERKRKQAEAKRRKAERARLREADKAARKRAGLDDEGGGSRAGREARAEWDREQAKRK